MKKKRQKCEIYSRVVGYLSPLSQWNVGKKSEFQDRETFDKLFDNEEISEKKEVSKV